MQALQRQENKQMLRGHQCSLRGFPHRNCTHLPKAKTEEIWSLVPTNQSLYRRLWCSRGKNSLIADSVEKRVVLRTFNWSVVLGSLCLELESAKRSRLLISNWQVKFWPKCSPHCGWIWHIFNLTALSWTKFLLLVRCKMSPDFCPEYTSGVTSNYRDA